MAVVLASGQVEGELRMNNLYGGLGLCVKLLLLFNYLRGVCQDNRDHPAKTRRQIDHRL
jgi:hypothetical protein